MMASSWGLRLISQLPVASTPSTQYPAPSKNQRSVEPSNWLLGTGYCSFTSNHRAPQPAPSSPLRSGNAFSPALRRRRGPAAPGSPATGPVRATPETCRPTPAAMERCSASASGERDDLQTPAAGAGTESSGPRLLSLRPLAAWAGYAPDPESVGRS